MKEFHDGPSLQEQLLGGFQESKTSGIIMKPIIISDSKEDSYNHNNHSGKTDYSRIYI